MLLFICALASLGLHMTAMHHEVRSVRTERWRWVVIAYLAVTGALYGLLAWSYAGVVDGSRTAEGHFRMVASLGIGPVLLLHPGILVGARMLHERLVEREIRLRLSVSDKVDRPSDGE